MNKIAHHITTAFAGLGLVLAAPVCAKQQTTPAPVPNTQIPAEQIELGGPALWKLADEDTTIYLFGTVHALPQDVEWFNGSLADALAQSDTVVTEIEVDDDFAITMQSLIEEKGMLPEGTSLRSLMSPEERATYEAAMAKLGLQPAAFAPFEPWFVGMTISIVPLLQQGYSSNQGVEKILLSKAEGKSRIALEAVEEQITVFDTLPEETQMRFLIDTAKNVDQIKPMLDAMVAEWLDGDAEELASLMNEGMTDDVLAEALLYRRNQTWAQWLDERMEQPGTVFVAVGAGHLAGKKSVQDYLDQLGIKVSRVQ